MIVFLWLVVFLTWTALVILGVVSTLVYLIPRVSRLRNALTGPPGCMGMMGEDIWVESEYKGYTNLGKEEWLSHLNHLIDERESRSVEP